jgi:hypothetical protein
VDPAGLTTSPPDLEQAHPVCTGAGAPANVNVPLVEEILCGNEGSLVGEIIPCPGGKPYPSPTEVVMHPLPKNLPTMPDPCADVPVNPWCPGRPVPPPPPPGLG